MRLGRDCHTPSGARAPESKSEPGAPLTDRSDIWSLATALWEIMGMKPVFSNEFRPKDEIVAQHIDVLGPMPSDWWLRWKVRDEFLSPRMGSRPIPMAKTNGRRSKSGLKLLCRNGGGGKGMKLGRKRKPHFWIQCAEYLCIYRKGASLRTRSFSRTGWSNGHCLTTNEV